MALNVSIVVDWVLKRVCQLTAAHLIDFFRGKDDGVVLSVELNEVSRVGKHEITIVVAIQQVQIVLGQFVFSETNKKAEILHGPAEKPADMCVCGWHPHKSVAYKNVQVQGINPGLVAHVEI